MIRFRFLRFFIFLLISINHVSGCEAVREQWIIDAAQEGKWKDLLQVAGMTHEYAQTALAQYNLAKIKFGEVSPKPYNSDLVQTLNRQPQCLYENGCVSVYYPSSPRVRHHLWVVLNRPVDCFAEVTSDERVQMQATVNQIMRFLRNNFGLTALIAYWNTPPLGQLEKRFTIEIVPNRLDSLNEHNLRDKVFANSYLFFRDIFPQPALPLAHDEEDTWFWRQALSGALPEPFLKTQNPDPVVPWTQVQTHRNEAGAALMDHLYRLMVASGLNVERVQVSDIMQPDILVVPKSGCAFCVDKVINSQKVHESEYCWILFNFKPAVPNAHFLIVPKRHVYFMDGLSEEEIRDMHEQAKILAERIAKREGREDITFYIQDGLEVSQSIKHAHMHVLLTPDPLRYTFFSLNFEKEKTLTAEELEAIRKELSF